jgi:uncharacterized membrane protein (DUF4010 family)
VTIQARGSPDGAGGLQSRNLPRLSGLTDMDAITLSTAQLVNADRLDGTTGWRLILVGAMANLVFKGAVVTALGGRRLRSRIALFFGLALAGAAVVLLLWPA